jgi:hypothetical protein
VDALVVVVSHEGLQESAWWTGARGGIGGFMDIIWLDGSILITGGAWFTDVVLRVASLFHRH